MTEAAGKVDLGAILAQGAPRRRRGRWLLFLFVLLAVMVIANSTNMKTRTRRGVGSVSWALAVSHGMAITSIGKMLCTA